MKRKTVLLGIILATSMTMLCGCKEKAEDDGTVSVEEALANDQEGSITSAEENVSDATEYKSLDDEIRDIEAKQAAHDAELSDDATQLDMNIHSAESLKIWDDELNSLWSRFSDAADEDFKNKVLAEQREWIKLKEEKSKEAGSYAEGGSLQPLLEDTTAQEYTRVRCYELAAYLAEATNTEFTLEIPKVQTNEQHFADYQGTTDIYSELIIKETPICYDITISLHGITTLEGEAYENQGDIYYYVDNDHEIEGTVRINGDSASFEVTKSDFDGISVGYVFEFPDRL